MQHLAHGRELVAQRRELVGVGAGQQGHGDQRLQLAPSGRWVDLRRESGDDAGAAQAADAVGCGIRTQPDGGTEVAPRNPSILSEHPEYFAVNAVHCRDYRSPSPAYLESHSVSGQTLAPWDRPGL